MWRIVLFCLLLWVPTSAQAAYTLIQWSWSQGSGPAIDGFKVKCGRASGVYTIFITVADPTARSLSVYTATNGRGEWFCTVIAYNSTAESVDGNEINFVLPPPPPLLFPGF